MTEISRMFMMMIAMTLQMATKIISDGSDQMASRLNG